MIAQLQTALKWKLCHHAELKSWIKGSIALMGDSSHPTLPYQAQGAAMAVEDGAVIGTLLGRLQACPDLVAESNRQQAIGEILNIYERLRKQRTTVNVKVSPSASTRCLLVTISTNISVSRERWNVKTFTICEMAKIKSTETICWSGSTSQRSGRPLADGTGGMLNIKSLCWGLISSKTPIGSLIAGATVQRHSPGRECYQMWEGDSPAPRVITCSPPGQIVMGHAQSFSSLDMLELRSC